MSKFTREEIWKHNSFLGSTAFARKGMTAIINSKTATSEARQLAYKIESDLFALTKLLKNRDEG